MKKIFAVSSLFALITLTVNAVMAVERKLDSNGNEYFIVTEDEIEAKNKRPPVTANQPLLPDEGPEPSYKEIALQMKAGCAVAENDQALGATVVDLDDFFVVIPTQMDGLPPYPGEAGKLTMHGIDSDNDCVRDDIEHFIANRFKGESKKDIRKHFFEYAIWLDFFLIQGISESNAQTADKEMSRIGTCIQDAIGLPETISQTQRLIAEFHNTFDRSHRYIENSSKIGGWTQKGLENVLCI